MLDFYFLLNVFLFFAFQRYLRERTKVNFALSLWYLPILSVLVVAYSSDIDYIQEVLGLLTLSVCSFYLGFILGQRLSILNIETRSKISIILHDIYAIIASKSFVLVAIQIGMTVVYIILIGGISRVPILSTGIDVIALREDSFKNQSQIFNYIFGLSRNIFFPYISTTLLLCYLQNKSTRSFLIFFLSASSSVVYLSLSSALSPVLSFIMQLIIVYSMISWISGKRLAPIAILLLSFLLLAFAIIFIIGLISGNSVSLTNSIQKLLQASLLRGEEVLNACSAFLSYAHTHSSVYFGLAINAKISELLGIKYININNEVFTFLNPRFSVVTTGTYNAPWFIYQYLSFGILGVVSLSLFWGLLWGIQLKIVSLSIYSIPYFALVSYASFIFWDKPISTSALSLGGLSLFGIYSLILLSKFTFGMRRSNVP
jgi:hypothetical protein